MSVLAKISQGDRILILFLAGAGVQEARQYESKTETRFERQRLKCRDRLPSRVMGVSMRLLSIFILVAVCFVCSSGSVGSRSAAEQPDISSSGSKFLEICSDIDNQPNGDLIRVHNLATCLGWVEGFRDGFSVHDELLGVPEKDRMVCVPRGITTIQIVRVMKKYIAENPDKAHRATRFIASVSLARAFSCKAGK